MNKLGLGNVAEAIPDAILDIRYATTNNITGKQLYGQPVAYLRDEPLEALVQIARIIRCEGLRLVIHDALRPQSVQDELIKACPDPMFVLPISNHRRGTAIDGTLAYADGTYLDMGTDYDDFTELANADSTGITERQREYRLIWDGAMQQYGYAKYPPEWYHRDFEPHNKRELFDDAAIAHLF